MVKALTEPPLGLRPRPITAGRAGARAAGLLARFTAILFLVLLAAGLLVPAAGAVPPQYTVLVFTRANAGRHVAATNAAVAAITELGRQNDFWVNVSTNPFNQFTAESLERYRAVIFLNTSGDVLNDEQQAAFEQYLANGNGFVGVHAAAETETTWPFYVDMLGTTAVPGSHSLPVQPATVIAADRVHPSSAGLPERWAVTDQWYNYAASVRGVSHVLATVDETTYAGGTMGFDHPIAWCKNFQGGRSWYTGLGHTAATFTNPDFAEHLLRGIEWSAGTADGDCGATVLANYERTTLNSYPNLGEPMGLAVLPDGRVLHNTRNGVVRLYDPATGLSPIINTIPVYQHDEDGLQFVAVDPGFAENRWVYIYYAPPLNTPVDDPGTPGVNEGNAPDNSTDPNAWVPFEGYNQLSRVKLVETPTPQLDMATEQQILRVNVDRGICCHVGGDIEFDDQGLLYLTTGDDTNAGGSDGFTPINDQTSPTIRGPGYDARRSAGNTNDLRGKLLRIEVNADGTYSIPEGNLFPPGTALTRPEIYLMGLRNPFRFDVSSDGVAYISDYSPDSRVPNPNRGPEGTGRHIVAREAANYGWPFCMSSQLPYREWDFATQAPGEFFDCANGPVNDSYRNTGLAQTPPVTDPDIWYTYNAVTPCPEAYVTSPPQMCSFLFPELLTGGVGPHSTALYDFDPALQSEVMFPEYYDGTVIWGEFTRDYLREFRWDSQGGLLKINPMLNSEAEFGRWDNPMDSEFGPDGCLYMLDYGDGFFRANPDAQLSKVCYVRGTRSPVAAMSATPSSGSAPLTVQFSSDGSLDPDPGDSITLAWDFQNDGIVDSIDPDPTFTYTTNGTYVATLTVTDSTGKTAVASRTITVGNTAPTITITTPVEGGFFDWGDNVPWTVTVTDPEDGTIDCSRVAVDFVLGHDTHGHGVGSTTGCSGVWASPASEATHASGYVFGAINAAYTDNGGLTSIDQAVVQTRRQQAEFPSASQGVEVTITGDPDPLPGAGLHQTSIDPGDWLSYNPVNLLNIDSLTFRVAGGSAATVGTPRAAVEVHLDEPNGPLVTTATILATAGNNAWESQTVPIVDPGGTHPLFLVFRPVPGGPATGLFNLNWIEFGGLGVTVP